MNLVEALWLVQDGRCFHCGLGMLPLASRCSQAEADAPTKEHVKPLAVNKRIANNIVLAHRRCNEQRGCRAASEQELDLARLIYVALGSFLACVPAGSGVRQWSESVGWSGKTVAVTK